MPTRRHNLVGTAGRSNVVELREFLTAHAELAGATSAIGLIETVRSCDRAGSFPQPMTRLRRDYDELGDALVCFVTYHRRMATAARARGLPVASPGVESWH